MMVEGKQIEKQKIPVGTWSNEKRFEKFENYTFRKPKPFYRVGKKFCIDLKLCNQETISEREIKTIFL